MPFVEFLISKFHKFINSFPMLGIYLKHKFIDVRLFSSGLLKKTLLVKAYNKIFLSLGFRYKCLAI